MSNPIYDSNGVSSTIANNIVTTVPSGGSGTIYYSVPSTSISVPYVQTQENNKMSNCGISINCTVPSYAWNGLDFALHGVGLAIVILACTAAFFFYKKAMKSYK